MLQLFGNVGHGRVKRLITEKVMNSLNHMLMVRYPMDIPLYVRTRPVRDTPGFRKAVIKRIPSKELKCCQIGLQFSCAKYTVAWEYG